MLIDIRTLKRKVDSITTNLAIYECDLQKHEKRIELKGIDSIPEHIEKLKAENKDLIKHEQVLLRKANRILSRIER